MKTKPKKTGNWAKDIVQTQMRKAGFEVKRYIFTEESHQTEVPLPEGANEYLRRDNPKLLEMQKRNAATQLPVTVPGLWGKKHLKQNISLSYFRGDNAYVWGYRNEPLNIVRMRFYMFARYIESIDKRGLMKTITEDGGFGCWYYDYKEFPKVSRDQLDSINELYFLDRNFKLFDKPDLKVLDIGAGYGRMAYRMLTAAPNVSKYYCTDAIPESSFICDYYLRHRKVDDRAEVVTLDELDTKLKPGTIDLAINIHSFSECNREAIRWWLQMIVRLQIPYLLLLPNDLDQFNSTETNGDHLPYLPMMQDMGFEMVVKESIYRDSGYAEFVPNNDMIYLFKVPGHA